MDSGPLWASSLRLLTFMTLRWSPLVLAPAVVPFIAWASRIVAPFVVFTLPFCCPSVDLLGGACGVGVAGDLTGSRSDCTKQRKEKQKEEIVGHMRGEREAAHCEP